HTVEGRADPVRLASLPRMPIPLRRFVVVVHVISSVGWLGLTMGNLILAITGLTTNDPQLQHSVYRIAALVGGMILVPIGLITLVTGLLLGLLTRGGARSPLVGARQARIDNDRGAPHPVVLGSRHAR